MCIRDRARVVSIPLVPPLMVKVSPWIKVLDPESEEVETKVPVPEMAKLPEAWV